MGQDVRRRKQVTINFTANSEVSETLGRGMVYRALMLRLRLAPTLTAANNTQVKTLRGDEWAVVRRIEIVANNTDVIWNVSGNELWWINRQFFNTDPHITPALGDAATANPPVDTVLTLPFWMFRSVRPMDTALDARILSDLKLRVTWGQYTDINADATGWTTQPSIEVHSLESTKIKGPFSTQRIFAIEKEITATNPQFQIQLPVGPLYRGFLINTTDGANDAGGILNNLKIVSGTTVYADVPNAVLEQYDGWIHQGMPHTYDGFAGALGNYGGIRRGAASSKPAGWRFYDHVTDGFMSEAIDTLGFSEFTLDLDVTVGAGTTKIHVIPIQVIPVRGKGNNRNG